MRTEHLKRVSSVFTGSTPPTNMSIFYDTEDVEWFNPGDLDGVSLVCKAEKKISNTYFQIGGAKMFPKNTVLMVGIGATVGKVGYVDYECFSNQQINAIVFNEKKINSKFGAYWLLSKKDFINKTTPCVTLPIFNQSKVKMVEITYPSLIEQQRIVDYLDNKLATIDHRVEVLEKEKDAYARLKKSVINQAVTRGLNPNVSLKDSGIDWIGMIPEHWELMRIKDVVSINKDSLGEDTDETYKFRYIDISNVSSEGEITLSDEMYFYDAPSRARRIVRKGDVIVSTVRTYLRAIAQIDFEAKDIIASTGFAVLSPKECMCSSYLAYVIRSSCIVDSICAQSTGVSYPAISSSKLSAIDMPLPSLSEQQAIADYLDEKCAKIDAAIENISKQIDASKRLKKAVINEAISGKINFEDN